MYYRTVQAVWNIATYVYMLLKPVNSYLNKGYNLCTKHSLMVMNQNKEGGLCSRCAYLWISIHCKIVCSQQLHHLAFLSLETGNFSKFYYFWTNKKFLIKYTTWFQMFVYLFQGGYKNAWMIKLEYSYKNRLGWSAMHGDLSWDYICTALHVLWTWFLWKGCNIAAHDWISLL